MFGRSQSSSSKKQKNFPFANVTVNEDAPNTVIDLFAAFADTEDADASLTYTITANTNPALFAAIPIDGTAGTMTLDYAPNANGTANITVRATDTTGLWVEDHPGRIAHQCVRCGRPSSHSHQSYHQRRLRHPGQQRRRHLGLHPDLSFTASCSRQICATS